MDIKNFWLIWKNCCAHGPSLINSVQLKNVFTSVFVFTHQSLYFTLHIRLIQDQIWAYMHFIKDPQDQLFKYCIWPLNHITLLLKCVLFGTFWLKRNKLQHQLLFQQLYSKEAFNFISKEIFNTAKVSSVFIQVSNYSSRLFMPTLCCWKWELTKQC